MNGHTRGAHPMRNHASAAIDRGGQQSRAVAVNWSDTERMMSIVGATRRGGMAEVREHPLPRARRPLLRTRQLDAARGNRRGFTGVRVVRR